MNQAEEARKQIVARLESDLVGPLLAEEVLEAERIKPSDVYLTGILWPLGDRMDAGDDDGSGGDDEEDESPSSATVVGQQRPCCMGLSFATKSEVDEHRFSMTVRFATYEHSTDLASDGKNLTRWARKPYEFKLDDLLLLPGEPHSHRLHAAGLEADVEIQVRTLRWKQGLLATVTLINRSRPEDFSSILVERLTLFQTALEIRPTGKTRIVPRPPAALSNDPEHKSARLLYRNCHEYAAGHQCSVSWETEGESARRIASEWIPRALVPAFKEDGSVEFEGLVNSGALDAHTLADASDNDLQRLLGAVPAAYSEWIRNRNFEIKAVPTDLSGTAKAHLQTCQILHDRIQAGINAIGRNVHLRESFRYANAAMALQHSWKASPEDGPLRWRPFQLGFILLAAESSCDPESENREILDLLWFPTGGGKTEAYLAIIAMVGWYRRLTCKDPDEGSGNAAVMRYTLRLLTAQQFERASSMILASELIRRGAIFPRVGKKKIGTTEFSVGLWVGKDATPNNFKKALETRGHRDGSTAEQIYQCPCCHSTVRWDYDENTEKVRPYCEHAECLIGAGFGKWPVYTVDSDIYSTKPTLLIGTVDKFAQLPFKTEVAGLFGFGTSKSTDVIIQDELHLISGPLGTITGLYETAFDWLLRKNGKRPKILGSTATIRRAEQQVLALFDRKAVNSLRRGCHTTIPALRPSTTTGHGVGECTLEYRPPADPQNLHFRLRRAHCFILADRRSGWRTKSGTVMQPCFAISILFVS
ncbi:hypothetical protein ACFQAT_08470 [Undibacterium arcticum]|uniref:hypothetical protein n=1 Tax=Undibacterium arcticum TaxID=1762892 RepID=UPI00360C0A58